MFRVPKPIRVAAAGDIHCAPGNRAAVAAAFARVEPLADLVLLAGDLTTYGEPEQAAVLGNHDWPANRHDEVVSVLTDAGVIVLDKGWTIRELDGARVGVVGTK